MLTLLFALAIAAAGAVVISKTIFFFCLIRTFAFAFICRLVFQTKIDRAVSQPINWLAGMSKQQTCVIIVWGDYLSYWQFSGVFMLAEWHQSPNHKAMTTTMIVKMKMLLNVTRRSVLIHSNGHSINVLSISLSTQQAAVIRASQQHSAIQFDEFFWWKLELFYFLCEFRIEWRAAGFSGIHLQIDNWMVSLRMAIIAMKWKLICGISIKLIRF